MAVRSKVRDFDSEIDRWTDAGEIVITSHNKTSADADSSDSDSDTSLADTESVDSDTFDYGNADTDSVNSDDYDDTDNANADTDSADSDCDFEEIELDDSVLKTCPQRKYRRKRIVLPRWEFLPPVFRDGHWIVLVQQCDANPGPVVSDSRIDCSFTNNCT